jgi:hypothetical protein
MLYSMAEATNAAAFLCNAAANQMIDPGQNAVNQEQRVFRGYVVGVFSGTTVFWIAAIVVGAIYEMTAGSWGIIRVGLWYIRIVVPIVILISLFMSQFLVAMPFLIIYFIAKSLKIRSAIYYVCSGITIAFFFFSLWLAHAHIYWTFPPTPFWPDRVVPLVGSLLGGASGAFMFWWIAIRDRATSKRCLGRTATN